MNESLTSLGEVMHYPRLSGVLCLFLLSAPLSAMALNLAGLPQGMCPLDENVEAEKVVRDYMQAANASVGEVVSVFGDCNELRDLAAGKRPGLAHYGSIIRQTQLGAMPMSRAAYLESAASAYGSNAAILADAASSAQSITSSTLPQNGLSPVSNLQANSSGVLHKDENLIVMGVAQNQQVNGKSVAVTSTAGLTLIEGMPISINLYAPASDRNGQDQAVASLVHYGTALVAANPVKDER